MFRSLVTIGIFLPLAHAQVCRLSIAGLNQARRVPVRSARNAPSPVHSTPFGNWGVTSNYGQKGYSISSTAGATTCASATTPARASRSARTAGTSGTAAPTIPLYTAPNCSLYNAAGAPQQTTTGSMSTARRPSTSRALSVDTNGDGVPDQGGCRTSSSTPRARTYFRSTSSTRSVATNSCRRSTIRPPACR